MTNEEIITILGLILMLILFYFSLKMGFEHLIKNYNKEIKTYYEQNGYSIIKIRKPLKNEKAKNPFLKTISFRPFMLSPLIIQKYRIVKTKNKKGAIKKNWVEIKIRYLRKPKLRYE
jgi:hypothetical protein